jgi:hypothetical protein
MSYISEKGSERVILKNLRVYSTEHRFATIGKGKCLPVSESCFRPVRMSRIFQAWHQDFLKLLSTTHHRISQAFKRYKT